MEIENPKTAVFVTLLGAFNFVPTRSRHGLPDTFSFRIDWTKGGEGQEILREHLRLGSLMRVKQHDKQYQGVLNFEHGINSCDGAVVADVRP